MECRDQVTEDTAVVKPLDTMARQMKEAFNKHYV